MDKISYIEPSERPDWLKGFIVSAPCNGEILPLSQHPNPIISNGFMGAGVTYIPNDNKLSAPIDGSIVEIGPGYSHIKFKADNGLILILGFIWQVETLMTESIQCEVRLKQKVVKGQTLFRYNQTLFNKALANKIGYCTVVNCKGVYIPFYHKVKTLVDPIFSIRSR